MSDRQTDLVFYEGERLHFVREPGNDDSRLVYRGDLVEVTR